jgi:fructokinase
MQRPSIIACGEVLWDLFPDRTCFGGAPANFACQAAMLGGDVRLLTAVGNDPRGKAARQLLRDYGVDTELVQNRPDFPTGTVAVTLDAHGSPTFTIHAPSAWDYLEWDPRLIERITPASIVYFGTLGQRGPASRAIIQRTLKMAQTVRALRILDINLRPPFFDAELIRQAVSYASVLKISDSELPIVSAVYDLPDDADVPRSLSRLRQQTQLDLIALTQGAEGAWLIDARQAVQQAGIPTEVCDTVGAGDAFTAALGIGLWRGMDLPLLAEHACRVAAATCAHPGAIPPC